jgi:hypothetical protein
MKTVAAADTAVPGQLVLGCEPPAVDRVEGHAERDGGETDWR